MIDYFGGVDMSNVYDIWSGEPVKIKKTAPRNTVVNMIESLYQRRNQFDEIMIVFVEKGTNSYGGCMSVASEYSGRSMVRWMEDMVALDDEL